jgi:hypothetical protein
LSKLNKGRTQLLKSKPESFWGGLFSLRLSECTQTPRQKFPKIHSIYEVAKTMLGKNGQNLAQTLNVFYRLTELTASLYPFHF